jgi:hypothetical protein
MTQPSAPRLLRAADLRANGKAAIADLTSPPLAAAGKLRAAGARNVLVSRATAPALLVCGVATAAVALAALGGLLFERRDLTS